MKILESSIILRNPDRISKSSDENTYILDDSTDSLVTLNSTGTDIWNFLETKKTVAEICNMFRDKYEESDNLQEDVMEFITTLVDAKILLVESQTKE